MKSQGRWDSPPPEAARGGADAPSNVRKAQTGWSETFSRITSSDSIDSYSPMSSSTPWGSVSVLSPHPGRQPRPLNENATTRSCPASAYGFVRKVTMNAWNHAVDVRMDYLRLQTVEIQVFRRFAVHGTRLESARGMQL